MKTVFEGEIVNAVPAAKGLIIAYICDKDIEANTATLAYKMVTFEDGKLINVPKSLYELTKFGPNYQSILPLVNNRLTCKAVLLGNNKVFLLENDGQATLTDAEGEPVWKGKLEHRGMVPSGIAISSRSVWTCYKENAVLMRLNLVTMREELRIGSGANSPFQNPTDLFIDGDDIYVCNANNTVVKVNLNSYVTEEYLSFEQPLLQYLKIDNFEFAVLKNGVYLID